VDYDLSAEEQAVREVARRFARDRLAPGVAERDRNAAPDPSLLREMGELGLLGLPYPAEEGGSGLGTVAYALAVEEVARVDASTALSFAAHVSLGCGVLHQLGSEDQRRRYLPAALSGEKLVAFGLTEPDAGSDAGATRTRAEPAEGGFRLTGVKRFITNGVSCDLLVLTAREPDGSVSAFLVECPAQGVTASSPWHKLGMRGSETAEIVLDGAWVPAQARLGPPGAGLHGFLAVLDAGRISIGALGVGILAASLEAARTYATGRRQFGRPIAAFQAVAFKLADMAVAEDLARVAVLRAAWLKDRGRPFGQAASIAKLYATEQAFRCADQAVQVHGGYGYMQDYPAERFLRDAKLLEIGEGTSEVQRLVIARHLGLGA
jgi:alkylation response protein AidB-like acyl-CoA dehydrogenase